MRPAAAIAWEFRRKHRWGLFGLSACLIVIAAVRVFLFETGRTVDFEDTTSFALVVVVPITASFLYLLAVFSFGLSGDVAARTSMYPARMFTLPVTTGALAGWPMLYGTAAMAILWFLSRTLAIWPPEVDVPVVWPALLAASLLAWTQALTWMPYPLPGLRVIVAVLWLAAIDAVVMAALDHQAREPVMLALLAPHVPLAYLTARFAVSLARRGHVPDWGGIFAGARRIGDVPRLPREPFPSPARAQAWFEWRRHGRSLPAMVAMALPFELALLFPFRETASLIYETLLLVSITPPFLAAFSAATVRKSSPEGRSDSHGMTPFLSTRPLTSAALVAAKLNATIRSTLAAWSLVLVAVPLALRLSGTWPLILERARRLGELVGTPRAVALVLLGLAALLAATWKQLVQGLFIGLSGREWAVKASVFGALSVLAVAGPLFRWISGNHKVMGLLWNAIPSILVALVLAKLLAAAWIAARLHQSRLLGDRTLVIGAACFDVCVLALYGLLLWLVPTLLVRSTSLAAIAILEVPLARLSAAPLALAWNRHR